MTTKDYITAIAIEKLLEDATLPADIRQQAESVLFELTRETEQ
jgi:uncharacterized protein (UPF0147 family)